MYAEREMMELPRNALRFASHLFAAAAVATTALACDPHPSAAASAPEASSPGTPAPAPAPPAPCGPAHGRIESSVRLSAETAAKAAQAARDAYDAALAPYARISREQAAKAALARFPGARAEEVHLQSVHRNLVYISVLALPSGWRQLVAVDAGNGRVLLARPLRVKHRMPSRGM